MLSDASLEYARALETTPALLEAVEMETLEDGAGLVRAVEEFILGFVSLPAHTALPVALWCMGTHCYTLFEAFAYLAVTSPTKGCGKTRFLEVLELVVKDPLRMANTSEAVLFRALHKFAPTLLFDEAETLRGKGDRAESLRGILNAGNRRDAIVVRCQPNTFEPQRFNVYGPKVVAGIGAHPDTITDRSIVIAMQKKARGERLGRFLLHRVKPAADALRDRAAMYVQVRGGNIRQVYSETDLPFLEDRDCEAWQPLFAILSMADPSRLQELRGCAEALAGAKASGAEDADLRLRLLSDIRTALRADERAIFTAELLERLKANVEAPWTEDVPLNARKLGRMLRPFGIVPTTVRIGDQTAKGYKVEELEHVFSSYLGPETSQPSQPA